MTDVHTALASNDMNAAVQGQIHRDPSPAAMEQDKRKRKIGTKKASTFKPQPVQIATSSDTPSEEERFLPPPPSERKIARRRESMRAIRERPQSPSPPPLSKRQRIDQSSVASTSKHVEGLTFIPTLKPRPSMPRLRSPESTVLKPVWGSESVMGPPPPAPGGFVRKTRKSMAFQLDMGDMVLDEMVPLSESETPMIRKNKIMREDQSRRSSLGTRGNRARSSMDKGDTSVPHSSVDSSLFYTHISPLDPEPLRAKHLLLFCVDRAAQKELTPISNSKTKTRKTDTARTEEGDKLLSDIIADFSRGLGLGEIGLDFYSSGPSTSSISERPHPQNVANRATKQTETAIIRRCKEECTSWARLLHETRTARSTLKEQFEKKRKLDKDPDMSTADSWMRDALGLADEVLVAGEGELVGMGDFGDVEFMIDTLHQSTHAALQFTHQSQKFLDGIFTSLNNDLKQKERISTSTSNDESESDPSQLLRPTTRTKGKGKMDPIHMLRALANSESTPTEEVLTTVASVPPVPLGLGVTATPRRGTTPRRGIATPKRGE